MVTTARKNQEAADRRTGQVRVQLEDTQTLLASHQEQLAELKAVMERIHAEQGDTETTTNMSTAPSTPGIGIVSDSTYIMDSRRVSDDINGLPIASAAPPMAFGHMFTPVLRTDLPAYEDFRLLMAVSRKSMPNSRVGSGSFGGLNIPGLASGSSSSTGYGTTSSSTTSLPATAGQPHSPSMGSTVSSSGTLNSPTIITPLKETKFYKRALVEDIEPTLRLDLAPGLSWLARRTVTSSMSDATLVIEPSPLSTKRLITSCSLCGERRRGEEFARAHRFRTSENENSQWHLLCRHCVGRMRSSCDYIGFLRMVKDGHWRTQGSEAEKSAWEECVRLRERMFWSRIGGGVIPANIQLEHDDNFTATTHDGSNALQQPAFNKVSAISSLTSQVTDDSPSKEETDATADWSSADKSSRSDTGDIGAVGLEQHQAPSTQLESHLSESLKRTSLRDSIRFETLSGTRSKDRSSFLEHDTIPSASIEAAP